MQKLRFVNGNGVELDLTSGHYGITNWSGFSNADLTIQGQQVPFQDGEVFLDALYNPRELSVTLAINDNNNLALRYELKRELISVMNAKLGEGYLYYKNDYLERRIKVIPQLPVFENKNSNDSGTLKASLSWTAPEVYWEDVEETVVSLKSYKPVKVNNQGDIPCSINLDIANYGNTKLTLTNNNKKIQLSGTEDCEHILIDTYAGEKKVISENEDWKVITEGSGRNSVTYSEPLGIFCAVGANGTILTSSDGETWTSQISGVSVSLESVIYCEEHNLFYAVGVNRVLTSPDGEAWTSQIIDAQFMKSITYSKTLDMFCCVTLDGYITISSDGINWTTQKITDDLRSVTYSEPLGLFCAVGNNGTILTSSDGETWTSQTSGTSKLLRSVTYSESLGLFCAVGSSNTILTSSDGENWTNNGVNKYLNDVIYEKTLNMFYAVGNNGAFCTSSDGETWTIHNNLTNKTLNSIIYDKNLNSFCIVGDSNTILTSLDGETWTSQTSGTSNDLRSVIYSEPLGIFCAVGANGTILTSSDGETWTSQTSWTSNYLWSVTYSEPLGLFCAVGNNGTIRTSPDGEAWTSQTGGTSNDLHNIIYINTLNLFCIVGNEIILLSSDGINWTSQTITEVGLLSVTYSESLGIFCAVGGDGTILTSPDGEAWTSQTGGTSNDLWSVTYSEPLGLFCAVGGSNTILTSPDGETWASQTSPEYCAFDYIVYNEYLGIFCATGSHSGGMIFISPDGMNWTYKKSLGFILYSVIYKKTNGIFYAVGNSGAIVKSFILPAENIINRLSADSDLTFNLQQEENTVRIYNTTRTIYSTLTYRQRYLGV